MFQSALVALDATSASEATVDLAMEFCRRQASITGVESPRLAGLAVVDRPMITRPEPAPIGAGFFKEERDAVLLADAHEKLATVLDAFNARCSDAGIPSQTIECEGTPYERILAASARHDLIFIGQHTNFHFETSESIDDTLRRLVRHTPRPVIVAPEHKPTGKKVVIAYDGSIPSARSLQYWLLLDLVADDATVDVVCVADDERIANRRCEDALALLNLHGVAAESHAIVERRNPYVALYEHIESLDPQMVVMGASEVSGFRATLFSSMTLKMLSECPCPLFLSD